MLEIENLAVRYGERLALKGVGLQVTHGEVVALIGPNGAGKTTLIRAVSGLLPDVSGRVRYRGRDLLALSPGERARLQAVVPQARQLGGAYTVEHTVLLGRTAYMGWFGRPGEEDEAAVQWAMDQTAIRHLAGRRNAQLSGGEQQRVLLARALAQRTPVLLLDEPTSHLDLQHQVAFLSLIRRLARQEKLAVLLALHDLNQVAFCADRVALLVDGELQAIGEPAQVLTAEVLQMAYQTRVDIIPHPELSIPIILPRTEKEY